MVFQEHHTSNKKNTQIGGKNDPFSTPELVSSGSEADTREVLQALTYVACHLSRAKRAPPKAEKGYI